MKAYYRFLDWKDRRKRIIRFEAFCKEQNIQLKMMDPLKDVIKGGTLGLIVGGPVCYMIMLCSGHRAAATVFFAMTLIGAFIFKLNEKK
jgi:hypothetical protein